MNWIVVMWFITMSLDAWVAGEFFKRGKWALGLMFAIWSVYFLGLVLANQIDLVNVNVINNTK